MHDLNRTRLVFVGAQKRVHRPKKKIITTFAGSRRGKIDTRHFLLQLAIFLFAEYSQRRKGPKWTDNRDL